MDLNIPNKNTGDNFSANDFNQIKEAVNSKGDKTNFKTLNGESIIGQGDIAIGADVDLSSYLTTTGATSAFQAKGNYLVESDVIGKYLPTGATLSYLNLLDKPSIPSIEGLATESFVTSRGYLTSISWNQIGSKPSFFDGAYSSLSGLPTIPDAYSKMQSDAKYILTGTTFNYNDLLNKPTIPSLAGYATESFVTSKGFLTGVTYAQVSGKPTFSIVATSGSYADLISKPDLTVKADLVSGKVPMSQMPDANLNPEQFETLPDGTIGIKTSYLMSLGLGGVQLSAPALLAISGATSSALTVTWSGVTNATSYTLERADTATFTGSTIVYSGATTLFANTGLTAASNYYFRVKATAPNYIASSYSTVSGATTAAQAGVNYMTGFSPVMVLSGLTSGVSSTTTTGSTVYIQDANTEFNSTQNYHIPASGGGEIAVKIVDLTSNVSFGLTDNYQLSNPYGCRVTGNKIYQKNGSEEIEIVGATVAIGDHIILKTFDDNTGGGDNNLLRYFKIYKSSDGGGTRTEIVLPQGSGYNNSTTKFICFTNGNPSRLGYPQMKGAVAG